MNIKQELSMTAQHDTNRSTGCACDICTCEVCRCGQSCSCGSSCACGAGCEC